jgi:hypothetical protein
MRNILSLGTLILVGACGGSYHSTLTASPSAAPADVIACTRSKLDSLGFRPKAFDEVDHRYEAQKIDNDVRRADPQYRHNVERIEAQAAPAADGKTSLTVVGRTFAEYETHRGPTEEEERASAAVKGAVQAVLESCGRP